MKLSWRPLSAIFCVLLPLAMSGCVSASYMGIAFAPGAADPALQQLAQRAREGDKQAQLDLGIAFEEGLGVIPSRRRAITLYRDAAKDNPGTRWVYAPSPGGGAPARVLPTDGHFAPGLLDARRRLDKILNAPQ